MNKKVIITLIGLLLAIGGSSAAFYPEPFVTNLDINLYNISNADWISADTFNGTTIYTTTLNVSG